MNVNNTERWARLVVGALALLFAGVIYSWTILKAGFAEFGWSTASLSLNYTLTIMFFCIGGFVSGLVSRKVSVRTRILTSAALFFVSFCVTGLLKPGSSSILILYLAYGICAGFAAGLVYATVVGLAVAWFPDKSGLCSGVLMGSFGLTTFIIGNAAKAVAALPAVGWSKTYIIIAVAIGVVISAAAFFLRLPAPDTIFPAAKTPGHPQNAAESPAPRDYTTREMVKTLTFWKAFIFIILIACIGSAAIGLASDILNSLGAQNPAFLVSFLLLGNAVGRIATGALFDKLGIRKTQWFMGLMLIAAAAVTLAACLLRSLPLGILGIALCSFSYGFAPTSSGTFCGKLFGTKHFQSNFGVMNLILIPAPFAATLAAGLYQRSGSFVSSFVILTVVAVAALFVNLSIRTKKSHS
ncbi:MAG: MFS transporter [Oscillospiraceae bacterium]|jgi:OFA family oxalate/formate antiporter-like MFS transporter|nr:MFS transporter [Oscillospiraceae bacterium]